MKVAVLLNAEGYTIAQAGPESERERLAAAFAAVGIDAAVRLVRGSQVPQAIKEALATQPDAIAIGGGDGTISTAAGHLLGLDIPLGVLPFGTLNHFAKDLGLPLDTDGAVQTIAAGHIRTIDVAEVNGRIFVNNSSLGFYPEMLADRIRQQRQQGRNKWLAMALAFGRVLREFPQHRFEIRTTHGLRPRKTPCAIIANNCYAVTPPSLGARPALDGGELCVYIARRQSRLGWLLLIVNALWRGLSPATDFELIRVKEAEIRTRRRHLRVAHDGELEVMSSPLRYRIHQGALRVLAPATAAE